jgi:hypothetical protein
LRAVERLRDGKKRMLDAMNSAEMNRCPGAADPRRARGEPERSRPVGDCPQSGPCARLRFDPGETTMIDEQRAELLAQIERDDAAKR